MQVQGPFSKSGDFAALGEVNSTRTPSRKRNIKGQFQKKIGLFPRRKRKRPTKSLHVCQITWFRIMSKMDKSQSNQCLKSHNGSCLLFFFLRLRLVHYNIKIKVYKKSYQCSSVLISPGKFHITGQHKNISQLKFQTQIRILLKNRTHFNKSIGMVNHDLAL